MRKVLAAIAVVALSTPSYASAASYVGKVGRIYVDWSGLVVVFTEGSITNPSCAAGPHDSFSFDGTTAGGNLLLQTITTAFTSGRRVAITSTACQASGVDENVAFVGLLNY